MSKRHLLLIRHAKSDWGDPSLSDFDRPLNKRGERDAPAMGKRLAHHGIRLQYMLASPAARAKATAECIAQAVGFALNDIDWRRELYLASPADMLQVIRTCPEDVKWLAVVGHNPGISELAAQLSGNQLGDIPTCSVVHLETTLDAWREAEHFRLLDFDYPKRKH